MWSSTDGVTSVLALNFSPQYAAIAKALVVAQGQMGDVIKSNSNPAYKSKYADLASVIGAVQPALQSAKIAVIQGTATDFTDVAAPIVTVETLLLHESGEFIRNVLALKPTKNDPQGIGSAITYARRYALLALCGVAPEDDDGTAASKRSDTRREPQQRTDPPQETANKIVSEDKVALKNAWASLAAKAAELKIGSDEIDRKRIIKDVAKRLFPETKIDALTVDEIQVIHLQLVSDFAPPPKDDLAANEPDEFFDATA